MTNSKHANNKTKEVFVLCRGLIQKIDDNNNLCRKNVFP